MRKETKLVEQKWHPNPTHNGVEICHEHKRDTIIFTAWEGDNPVNGRQLRYDRHDVAYNNVPTVEDLDWLTVTSDED